MQKIFYLRFFFIFIIGTHILFPSSLEKSENGNVPISDQTEACLDCHQVYTPGIVEDWRSGSHAHVTPGQALKVSALKRVVSSESVPDNLMNVAVGCYECHGLNAARHQDNFDHFDYKINVIVTPDDCAVCHSKETAQYSISKKANALLNLQENPVYHLLVETITSIKEPQNGKLIQLESSDNTKSEACYGCHGTRVEVKGTKTVETDLGEIEVPHLTNWPNQGVGRINPDGSRGACTACHPRHSFSIEIARKPETCSQCHLEPDTPAWNVYRESKHGNIYNSLGKEWNWGNIPWVVGKDFKAPTCAACHSSLLVNTENEVIAERSHNFGDRLWVRIFGLIYSHPQPKDGQTFNIKNKDGLPLPTTFTGVPASEYLIDQQEQQARRTRMQKICQTCHASDWTENYFSKFALTIKEVDKMVLAATKLLLEAWDKGLADRSNPFDEYIEQKWIEQWLFFANSIRYASAMSGPDYAAFKNGWWNLTKNLVEMQHFLNSK